MLVSYVSAEIPDRLVVVGADVAYAFSSVALDDYGDPGLIASLDDVVDPVLVIQPARENDRTVKVMKIREIEDIHLACFLGVVIDICRIAEEQEYICLLVPEFIFHTGEELT